MLSILSILITLFLRGHAKGGGGGGALMVSNLTLLLVVFRVTARQAWQ